MKALFAAAALAALSATPAAAAPVQAEVAPAVVSADMFPKALRAFPGGVKAYPDLVYSQISGYRPMTLDLYVPPKAGGAKPLVIYIHGGGWTGGTSRNAAAYANFPAVLANLAARGYVVASVNYRLSGEARFPAAADDVDASIRWLRAHAADYGIDKTRVGIWGGSAGGQLAGLAATDCSPGDDKTESDCVQAAVLWYPVTDFATAGGPAPAAAPPPTAARPAGARPAGGPGAYLGCQPAACPDVVAKASPVSFVDPKDPPTLFVHGTADKTVSFTQSQQMLAKLKAAGVKAELVDLPGFDHSFIGKTPQETRAGHLKALQATFDWFDATIGKR
jgi:acetyl esterase/lipase